MFIILGIKNLVEISLNAPLKLIMTWVNDV